MSISKPASKKRLIVIVGEGLHLAISAAYLANQTKHLPLSFVAVNLDTEEVKNGDIGATFPPFEPAVSPILQRQLKVSPLTHILLNTAQSSDGFKFNFSSYGVPSETISFSQGYEIYKENTSQQYRFDAFLDARQEQKNGFTYSRNWAKNIYQKMAVRQGVCFVPASNIEVNCVNGSIKHISTDNNQSISGDLFIDCTKSQKLIGCLQTPRKLPESIVPRWTTQVKKITDAENKTSNYTISFLDSAIQVEACCDAGKEEYHYNFSQTGETAHYYENPWTNNCIALGNCFKHLPEVLISAEKSLSNQLGVLPWLLDIDNSQIDLAYHQKRFNSQAINQVLEEIDSLNLLLSNCKGVELKLTEKNQRRVQLFSSSANTIKEDNTFMSESAWAGLLHASGVKPKGVNLTARAVNKEKITTLTESLIKKN